jgi:hypothetical protein
MNASLDMFSGVLYWSVMGRCDSIWHQVASLAYVNSTLKNPGLRNVGAYMKLLRPAASAAQLHPLCYAACTVRPDTAHSTQLHCCWHTGQSRHSSCPSGSKNLTAPKVRAAA